MGNFIKTNIKEFLNEDLSTNSNLTIEQSKLVRTPEFKAWFGDWENDPENSSKVLDENGEPLVVYHSSDKEFNVFKLSNISNGFFFIDDEFDDEFSNIGVIRALESDNPPQWINDIMLKKGLTKEELKKEIIDSNYEKTRAFFLNIRKMYPFEWIGKVSNKNWSVPYYENMLIDKAIERGFGGIEFIKEDNNKRIIVAFNSNQIKLADGSNTTFDSKNPDIRK
jgi:hypothetical protein